MSMVDNNLHENPLNPKNAKSLFSEDGIVVGSEAAKRDGDMRRSRRILRGWPDIQKNKVEIPLKPGEHYADIWNDEWYFDFSETKWPQDAQGNPVPNAKPLKDWMNDILGQLQAVIDHYGSDFFPWFNKTPDGSTLTLEMIAH
jgi:hypothetical protein